MLKQRNAPLENAPPRSSTATPYDLEHLSIYLRILDGVADGADPMEVTKVVLGVDPDKEPERATRVFEAHYARAAWMMQSGYRYLLSGF